jgi:ABC-type Fe3+ transport system permease subunit
MTYWNGLAPRTRQAILLSLPLLSYLVPTVVIGYGMVIPGSCIAGWNEYTIGFASSIIGVIPTYISGVVAAHRTGAATARDTGASLSPLAQGER